MLETNKVIVIMTCNKRDPFHSNCMQNLKTHEVHVFYLIENGLINFLIFAL